MTITGVAIKRGTRIYVLPRPKRHHDVIRFLASTGMDLPISGEQGFFDDELGFLNREEALSRAKKNGQYIGSGTSGHLFSEDLW